MLNNIKKRPLSRPLSLFLTFKSVILALNDLQKPVLQVS